MDKIILNKRSNELVDGKAKAPTSEQLQHGEIAINYSKGNESIFIKNDGNEVINVLKSSGGLGIKDENTVIIPEMGIPDDKKYLFQGEVFNFTEDLNFYGQIIPRNKAIGQCSHAEGENTTASGDYSHAEGINVSVSGHASHAEGQNTQANDIASHAEGHETIASASYSHSEGYITKAIGQGSHAEGEVTTASGIASHAEGHETIADNCAQHSQGQYNTKEKTPSTISYDATKTTFSIGNGTSDTDRSDALKMLGNGTTWIAGVGDFNGKNPTETNSLQAILANVGLGVKDKNTVITAPFDSAKEEDKDLFRGEVFNLTKSTTIGGKTTPINSATGMFSHAEGYKTIASNNASHAEGNTTTASGDSSHAEGNKTTASGIMSHAEGSVTTASGGASHAEGQGTIASNDMSHAEGQKTIASGNSSHAEGNITTASGGASHAEGNMTTASGLNSHAEGFKATAFGLSSHAEGLGPQNIYLKGGAGATEYEICKGMFKNLYPFSLLTHKIDKNCHIKWIKGDKVNETYNINETRVENGKYYIKLDKTMDASNPIDDTNQDVTKVCYFKAIGKGSHNEGSGCSTIGEASHSENAVNVSVGDFSHSEGEYTVALGKDSHAEGKSTISSNFAQHSQGQYNKIDPSPSISAFSMSKTAFVIGNGTSDNDRQDAFRVMFNGTTQADGAYTTPAADYAEMFEWEDGNPNNEDRAGYIVELFKNKIRLATGKGFTLGIVSAMPAIIGDNPIKWSKKYATDKWGRPILVDKEIKYIEHGLDEEGNLVEVEKTRIDKVYKISEEYDNTKTFVERTERKEWDAIGLHGKLLVRQDGSLVAGEMATAKDGIAVHSSTGDYYVMEVIDNTQALVYIK